jgi:hypothetical protein
VAIIGTERVPFFPSPAMMNWAPENARKTASTMASRAEAALLRLIWDSVGLEGRKPFRWAARVLVILEMRAVVEREVGIFLCYVLRVRGAPYI